jgi:hypothetical protein
MFLYIFISTTYINKFFIYLCSKVFRAILCFTILDYCLIRTTSPPNCSGLVRVYCTLKIRFYKKNHLINEIFMSCEIENFSAGSVTHIEYQCISLNILSLRQKPSCNYMEQNLWYANRCWSMQVLCTFYGAHRAITVFTTALQVWGPV